MGTTWIGSGRFSAAAGFLGSDWGTVLAEHDFSDISTITDSGGAVSQVTKKSGSLSATIVQATGSRKPTTGTITKNGLNVLDFDGGDALAVDFADQAQPVTVAIVLKSDNPNSGQHQAFGNFADPSPTIFVNSDVFRYYCGTEQVTAVAEDANWHIVVGIFDGASSSLWIDGVQRITTNPGAGALKGITIGADTNFSFPWDGQIGHSICYSGAVASPSGLSGALNTKWAVY